ncbi:hypothetical protein [uncultured Mycobacterium sp.]|uniref:hypothetical protein n=1 Tax=uncultured Mycobacterium sp. TaxID=171292 RepID=UPI0035CB5FAE
MTVTLVIPALITPWAGVHAPDLGSPWTVVLVTLGESNAATTAVVGACPPPLPDLHLNTSTTVEQ